MAEDENCTPPVTIWRCACGGWEHKVIWSWVRLACMQPLPYLLLFPRLGLGAPDMRYQCHLTMVLQPLDSLYNGLHKGLLVSTIKVFTMAFTSLDNSPQSPQIFTLNNIRVIMINANILNSPHLNLRYKFSLFDASMSTPIKSLPLICYMSSVS
jgi:hypothetical protein